MIKAPSTSLGYALWKADWSTSNNALRKSQARQRKFLIPYPVANDKHWLVKASP